MRGIPEKLNTRQDLENVCESLSPGEALAYLKDIERDTLKQLGVRAKDLKALRQRIDERKQAERAKNKKLSQLSVQLAGTEEALDLVSREMERVKAAIRASRQAEASLPAKQEALNGLEKQITRLKVEGGSAPSREALVEDLAAAEMEAARLRETTRKRADVERQIEELTAQLEKIAEAEKKLTETDKKVSELKKSVSYNRPKWLLESQIQKKEVSRMMLKAEIKNLSDMADSQAALLNYMKSLIGKKVALKKKLSELKSEVEKNG
ncbi:MAG: hypothetical protein JRJ66_01420 [Deltaproteobacteria bacterium]|nr:hypothetical protein [Deltaproteobacteria bacterium]MBW2081695.1 hypothetical protein [Deltaproteobacteria bacterium]MBW2298890.1 hypothetical protein [Deltaproteobacteria bacterium]